MRLTSDEVRQCPNLCCQARRRRPAGRQRPSRGSLWQSPKRSNAATGRRGAYSRWGVAISAAARLVPGADGSRQGSHAFPPSIGCAMAIAVRCPDPVPLAPSALGRSSANALTARPRMGARPLAAASLSTGRVNPSPTPGPPLSAAVVFRGGPRIQRRRLAGRLHPAPRGTPARERVLVAHALRPLHSAAISGAVDRPERGNRDGPRALAVAAACGARRGAETRARREARGDYGCAEGSGL